MNTIKQNIEVENGNSFNLILTNAKFELVYNYKGKIVGEPTTRMFHDRITLTKNMFYAFVNALKTNDKSNDVLDDIIDNKYIKVYITFSRPNSKLLKIGIYNDIYDERPIQEFCHWVAEDGVIKLVNEIVNMGCCI